MLCHSYCAHFSGGSKIKTRSFKFAAFHSFLPTYDDWWNAFISASIQFPFFPIFNNIWTILQAYTANDIWGATQFVVHFFLSRLSNFKDSNYLGRSKWFDFFLEHLKFLKVEMPHKWPYFKPSNQLNVQKHLSSNLRSVRNAMKIMYLAGAWAKDSAHRIRMKKVSAIICVVSVNKLKFENQTQEKGFCLFRLFYISTVLLLESDKIIHSKKECKSEAIPNDWIICLLCFSWMQLFKTIESSANTHTQREREHRLLLSV